MKERRCEQTSQQALGSRGTSCTDWRDLWLLSRLSADRYPSRPSTGVGGRSERNGNTLDPSVPIGMSLNNHIHQPLRDLKAVKVDITLGVVPDPLVSPLLQSAYGTQPTFAGARRFRL